MAATDSDVDSTLSLIENARLPHPSGPLLESFISEALNPILAARYVKHRFLLGEASSLVADWSYIIESGRFSSLLMLDVLVLTVIVTENGSLPPRPSTSEQYAITKRDGGKCCVTGKAGTMRDPLIVAPILLVPSGWATDKVCSPSLNRSIIVEELTSGFESWVSLICSVPSLDRLTETGGYRMLEILE